MLFFPKKKHLSLSTVCNDFHLSLLLSSSLSQQSDRRNALSTSPLMAPPVTAAARSAFITEQSQSALRHRGGHHGNHRLSAADASARSSFSSFAVAPPSINTHQPCHQETSSLSQLLSSVGQIAASLVAVTVLRHRCLM